MPALPEGGLDLDGISLLGGRGNNPAVTGERLLGLTGFPSVTTPWRWRLQI